MLGHMGGKVLTQQQRDAIAEAIQRDPVPTHRAIAAEFAVGLGTVYDVAVAYGVADAWEHRREESEKATATRAALVAEKRQRLEDEALDAAREFLARKFNPKQVAIKGMEGAEVVYLDASSEDFRNIGQAVSNLSGSAVQLAKLESELSGAGQASGLLEQFEQSLREARQERDKPEGE